MTDARDLVNTWMEPTLFPSGGRAVTLEALVDHEEGTVLFVCTSRDVSAGTLQALWSSSPIGLEAPDEVMARAIKEWRAQVHTQTGPFA